MTSKTKMKREVRWLYKRLLKPNGKILDVRKIIGFYEEYNDFRGRVLSSPEAPLELKHDMQYNAAKMPKYLKWAKQYLI